MATTAAKIRAELKRRGRPYPMATRRRAIEYARAQLDGGSSATRIARELGISAITLGSWMKGDVLARVEVIAEPTAVAVQEVDPISVLDTRSGLRIEGLTLDAVVALLARLR